MYVVKDSNLGDLDYLKSEYNIELDMDSPKLFFTFMEDENVVGYSEITIEDDAKLTDFVIDSKFNIFEKLFYLKGTGSKVKDLGFDFMHNKTENIDFYSNYNKIIELDELFKGTCGGK